jgi:phenylacetate-CoA ligase
MNKEQGILSAFDFTKAKKKNWISSFYNFDITKFEQLLRQKSKNFWQAQGEKRALKLFHAAAARVPAYKDFLKKHKIRPELIKNIRDFIQIPLTNKKNYIQNYPLSKRCWDGMLSRAKLVAISSGTSGEPTFWARGDFQEFEAAVTHELLYRYLFRINKYKTLLVIGFPMGVYVSGVATLLPSWLAAVKREYNITIASVGNNKIEILRLVKYLQKDYQQIVLLGHPFFIKDVIESGRKAGIVWSDRRLHLMLCSEGFSEVWRKYLISQTGAPFGWSRVISVYGSSEMLVKAYETPLSILARNLAEQNSQLRQRLFNSASIPNLFQYNPFLRYIESVGDELIFTCASGLPLIRFNLHDSGRVIPFGKMQEALNQERPKWRKMLKQGEASQSSWQLPLVALWGRSDQTIIFYAANIYPEHIHTALNYRPFLKKITGKFVIRKGYLKSMDEFLEINIELRPSVRQSRQLARRIQDHVVKKLREINMEYLFLCNNLDKDLQPRIKLWTYQHKKYFEPGLKPKYIIDN